MKMNGRFKAAFILLIACLVCAIAAGAAGFIWKSNAVAMVAGAAGMACASSLQGASLAASFALSCEKYPRKI